MGNNIQYISEYQKANTVQVNMRLNKKYDADIIDFLNGLDDTGKATIIKQLIREDMGCEAVVRGETVFGQTADSDEELYDIHEVAAEVGTSVEKIDYWYDWKSKHPDNEYAALLPKFVRKGPQGQRYWYASAVAELFAFKRHIPVRKSDSSYGEAA